MHQTKPHRWRASEQMQSRAKQLRQIMTPAEKKLWQYLRNGQLNGVLFRRQCPVGPYIVDFFCAKAVLVIEVDGDSHADPDAERVRWLNEQKHYRVIRFWNTDILSNLDGVLAVVTQELARLDNPTSTQ